MPHVPPHSAASAGGPSQIGRSPTTAMLTPRSARTPTRPAPRAGQLPRRVRRAPSPVLWASSCVAARAGESTRSLEAGPGPDSKLDGKDRRCAEAGSFVASQAHPHASPPLGVSIPSCGPRLCASPRKRRRSD